LPRARLALEDGSIFHGRAIGDVHGADGETVFNTSLTGYQEILTDPSYAGQMVVMTYPLIGNYGISVEDMESRAPFLSGFVVRELCRTPSSFRSTQSLEEFLIERKVPCIEGVDTRRLTLRLREHGSLRGYMSGDESLEDGDLVERARASAGVVGMDFVKEVATREPYEWSEGHNSIFSTHGRFSPSSRRRVVAIDYGVKINILRNLHEVGCDLVVVPPTMGADEILARDPEGVFLSNGPGDPAALDYAAETVSGLLGRVPIFGICLGHQILARAAGAKTFKLPFGHHGGNHPVKDLATGKIEITAQNHGFAVDPGSLPEGAGVTHVNCNDDTVEGVEYPHLLAASVQYHPEASPGPHDSLHLFARFTELMKNSASTPERTGA